MQLLPLEIDINIEGGFIFETRKADAAFLRLQKKILSRDNNTCRFCGFRAPEYQEIVNIDGNYQNNHDNNLATACVFCAHAQLIGLRNNSKIIYVTDISQADLSQFMRILFCCSYYNERFAETAKSLIQGFKQRTSAVENSFGPNTSESVLFAQTYIDAVTPQVDEKQREKVMSQLRWLPSRTDYEDTIHYWADNVLTREFIENKIAAYGQA